MLLQQVYPILFHLFIYVATDIFDPEQLKLTKNTFRHNNLQAIKLSIFYWEFFANIKRCRDNIANRQVIDFKIRETLTQICAKDGFELLLIQCKFDRDSGVSELLWLVRACEDEVDVG